MTRTNATPGSNWEAVNPVAGLGGVSTLAVICSILQLGYLVPGTAEFIFSCSHCLRFFHTYTVPSVSSWIDYLSIRKGKR